MPHPSTSIRLLVAAAALAWLCTACNKQGPEPPLAATGATADAGDAAEAAAPPALPEPPPLPEAVPNAVAVGSSIGANGAAQAPKRVYAVSDTVHATVPTAGHAPDSNVTVYWTNELGTTDKEETKPIPSGAAYVAFEFSQADGMKPGDYNVQADVDDVPVGMVDFTVE